MKLIAILLAGFVSSTSYAAEGIKARDAVTGQYITQEQAKANPSTTVVESVSPCSYKKPTKAQKKACKAEKAKKAK